MVAETPGGATRKGKHIVATVKAASRKSNRSAIDFALLLNKNWEMPNQTEHVQDLKRSFGRVLEKLSSYRRLLINYRNGADVVMLYLDDWNRIVERQQELEERLERLEDLMEEMEVASTISKRSEASSHDASRLLGVDEFLTRVREERP